jgi:hypothetical protein
MLMNVTCPFCGQKCRVPESSFGQVSVCPACSGSFECGSRSSHSLEPIPVSPGRPPTQGSTISNATGPAPVSQTPPAHASRPPDHATTPPPAGSSGVHGTPDVQATDIAARKIRYRCPKCNKQLESAAHLAGKKANCPDCGQRLQIPQETAPSVGGAQQPALADAYARVVAPRPLPMPPPEPAPIPLVWPIAPSAAAPPAAPPVRTESCLECGTDVTHRARVHTCPDCGSLLCSAVCFRRHRFHAHPSRRG